MEKENEMENLIKENRAAVIEADAATIKLGSVVDELKRKPKPVYKPPTNDNRKPRRSMAGGFEIVPPKKPPKPSLKKRRSR